MSSQLHSTVSLVAQITSVSPPADPLEEWLLVRSPVEYADYYPLLFDVDGMLPWSESGQSFPFNTYYDANPEIESGITAFSMHLAGGIPGILEIGIWEGDDTDPDVPGSVQTFEFTSRVVTDLPISQVDSSDPESPPFPVMKWRFWPGALADLMPE